ncbi:MAG: DUF4843 domain-containing protein [Candidatus Pseudobacter hemicellulosilyticus]|uniref:DUF4843 domain-containing protein n=1 Tax=Candidatus Pseudobacter hemicellulosilyticus TaxID=3121375 RepID=A0AAJ5WV20_9BACT|nr:MAG: DUF4843 domain-containing protein [Pseudobacter sp.]
MKLSSRSIILSALLASLWAACSKEELSSSLAADNSVFFLHRIGGGNIGSTDSVSYSFVEKNSTVAIDTIWLTVRITGQPQNQDRPITLTAAKEGTTAVAGVHYKLLDYVMPKDSFQTQLGVVLLRDASLQTADYTLTVSLQPSAGFPVLMKEGVMADGTYYSKNSMKIIFTDRLIKPSNWDTYLITFFGPYSEAKLRFIAGVLGISRFDSGIGGQPIFPTMQYYQATVRNALIAYNAANGPLLDENNNPVVIP